MEKIHIVLASPSDLQEERQMIKELVASGNPLYMKNDICIDLRMWENVPPGMNDDGPQGVIDDDLEISKADIFICLYWKRIGTKIKNENVAGTEHELNLALENFQKCHKPDIKVFFKEIQNQTDDSEFEEIMRIRERLQPQGLYTPFKSTDELKRLVNQIIQAEVMRRIKTQIKIVPEIHNFIEVSTTSELIANLISNNKLVLNKGFYDVLDFSCENENVTKEEVFDGSQLVISNVSNITIVGDDSTILARPRYANVIEFRDCENIKIIGLTLGHTPQKGSCMGSVLRFDSCHNVQLESLELFGSGTYGIELTNCNNIHVNGSKIFECTYGALNIIQSNLELANSMIFDCNKTACSLISAYDSHLDLKNVYIFNNNLENQIIFLGNSTMFCRAVCIQNNTYSTLCNEDLNYGVFLDSNTEFGNANYYITITSVADTSREIYEKIKETIKPMGKIEEMVYEENRMIITAYLNSIDDYIELNRIVGLHNEIEMACG